MKILFTGASSFTGYWFVKTLAATGHELVCPLTGGMERYADVRRQRVDRLRSLCCLVPHAPFGSENFRKLGSTEKFDLFCHHAADVTNYKSGEFDAIRALENNVLNLRAVLKTVNCPVVLTGSVFESDEGAGLPCQDPATAEVDPQPAFSPYGLSKGLTFQYFRYYCHEVALPLGKFVIPNPFGPFEEPRFTSFLMKSWKAGELAEVKTPDYLRDNIHADLLAAVYADFAKRVAAMKTGLVKINPSGYAEKQGAFAQRVAREVKARTGWACKLKLARQEDFREPMKRINTEPAAEFVANWNEKEAWDGFVAFYTN